MAEFGNGFRNPVQFIYFIFWFLFLSFVGKKKVEKVIVCSYRREENEQVKMTFDFIKKTCEVSGSLKLIGIFAK